MALLHFLRFDTIKKMSHAREMVASAVSSANKHIQSRIRDIQTQTKTENKHARHLITLNNDEFSVIVDDMAPT